MGVQVGGYCLAPCVRGGGLLFGTLCWGWGYCLAPCVRGGGGVGVIVWHPVLTN